MWTRSKTEPDKNAPRVDLARGVFLQETNLTIPISDGPGAFGHALKFRTRWNGNEKKASSLRDEREFLTGSPAPRHAQLLRN